MYTILAEEAALDAAVFRDIPSAERWLTMIEERRATV
jgi:hypothetical protein